MAWIVLWTDFEDGPVPFNEQRPPRLFEKEKDMREWGRASLSRSRNDWSVWEVTGDGTTRNVSPDLVPCREDALLEDGGEDGGPG